MVINVAEKSEAKQKTKTGQSRKSPKANGQVLWFSPSYIFQEISGQIVLLAVGWDPPSIKVKKKWTDL
ncbi:hypothetical protein C943_04035 [Mariniradius saccharolyticus AK6]|uniref:Uncharacterized protein n=1 Tax=Mariniradius saccharolyticus AK6 TaxID=1239962 RepID=M7Y0E5_9BACT|nr:hypothetical protein C943_04035 [Mariniradius saccharolyticus AK6]